MCMYPTSHSTWTCKLGQLLSGILWFLLQNAWRSIFMDCLWSPKCWLLTTILFQASSPRTTLSFQSTETVPERSWGDQLELRLSAKTRKKDEWSWASVNNHLMFGWKGKINISLKPLSRISLVELVGPKQKPAEWVLWQASIGLRCSAWWLAASALRCHWWHVASCVLRAIWGSWRKLATDLGTGGLGFCMGRILCHFRVLIQSWLHIHFWAFQFWPHPHAKILQSSVGSLVLGNTHSNHPFHSMVSFSRATIVFDRPGFFFSLFWPTNMCKISLAKKWICGQQPWLYRSTAARDLLFRGHWSPTIPGMLLQVPTWKWKNHIFQVKERIFNFQVDYPDLRFKLPFGCVWK